VRARVCACVCILERYADKDYLVIEINSADSILVRQYEGLS